MQEIEVLMKVVCGVTMALPIVVSWQVMLSQMSAKQRKIVENPFVSFLLIFGAAFPASFDMKLSLMSSLILIGFVMFTEELM